MSRTGQFEKVRGVGVKDAEEISGPRRFLVTEFGVFVTAIPEERHATASRKHTSTLGFQ